MSTSSPSEVKRLSRASSHRSTLSMQRTEIKIHVYDLLRPGLGSSLLWAIGSSLLHSGVVIKDKEYAYGGHDIPRVSGVYWSRPQLEPPGGTYRCEILHGFSFLGEKELAVVIKEASERFQGTAYNLLTFNCNHFTSYLCERLTAKPAPPWLNRAASIGVALPCIVPREWIDPPDCDTADGELLDEDNECAAMMPAARSQKPLHLTNSQDRPFIDETESTSPTAHFINVRLPRRSSIRDTSGREIPASERAPVQGRA